jgi:phosphoribosylformylglycinamidine synthase
LHVLKLSPPRLTTRQERYVLAIAPEGPTLAVFEAICKRERCPYAVVGRATAEQELVVTDRLLGAEPIHLPMSTLFGKPPKLELTATTVTPRRIEFDATLQSYLPEISAPEGLLKEAIERVLHLPSVGSKSYLITIGDRTITGLVTRDQMVGPWQVPCADVAVTRASYGFDVLDGESMALGERTPLALLSPEASARMAVGEALTNIAASSIEDLSHIKLSANWMSPASHPGEGAGLYRGVQAIGMDLCPKLGVGIPVGKDSMSMKMRWTNDEGEAREVTSPMSVIITAFASCKDVSATWTPQLQTNAGETVLVFVDLAAGQQRLGGSALAQCFKTLGSTPPDVESAETLKAFFKAVQTLKDEHAGTVLAYHDRSDGGLLASIVEMCFAGRVGAEIDLDDLDKQPTPALPVAALFNEELGAVFQVSKDKFFEFTEVFDKAGFPHRDIHVVAKVNASAADQAIRIIHHGKEVFASTRGALQQMWSETSYKMQAARDDPAGAKEEFDAILDGPEDSGIRYTVTAPFLPLMDTPSCPTPSPEGQSSRPKVAILREQGVNGHVEMAFAFAAAGFEAVDVHMSDIIAGGFSLAGFRGLAACGGFSYGDVLGAGNGWAKSVLLNETARKEFSAFFTREDTFGLGVCNGCQFFSQLRDIIPGAEHWPLFKTNRSERFEGRVSTVKITASANSVFLRGMTGTVIPVAVAHGEGRAAFPSSASAAECIVPVQYVDAAGRPTTQYPLNPNGSPDGIAAVETPNGRVLAIMPHPERVIALESNSWVPSELKEAGGGLGPWFRIFQNAREFCS